MSSSGEQPEDDDFEIQRSSQEEQQDMDQYFNNDLVEVQKIFKQLCDKELYQSNVRCLVDHVDFKKKKTKKQHCQFCGFLVCKNCSQKKRQNPEKPGEFVTICDLCDEKYLRRMVEEQDKEEQFILDQQIQGYERALNELNNDYRDAVDSAQQTKNIQSNNKQKYQVQLDQKQSQIDKLKKGIQQLDQKLSSIQEDEDTYLIKISEIQKDINNHKEKLENLKLKDNETKEKIEEYNQKIDQLNNWLQNTNKKVSNWAINNKRFESFRANSRKTGTQSSLWRDQTQGSVDYNDNEIFRELYTDSEDEEDGEMLNSEAMNALINE